MSRVQEIVRQKKDVPLFPGVISVFEFPPHVPISIAVPQVKQIVPQSRDVKVMFESCVFSS